MSFKLWQDGNAFVNCPFRPPRKLIFLKGLRAGPEEIKKDIKER